VNIFERVVNNFVGEYLLSLLPLFPRLGLWYPVIRLAHLA